MDWATKIATKPEIGIEGQEPEQFIAAMSDALRKVARENKAAGMREAAEMMERELIYGSGDSDVGVVILNIYQSAHKIEHGEPTE